MNRRTFLTRSAASLALLRSHSARSQSATANQPVRLRDIRRPLAITMWDFSWLERRWPGAGYDNWDLLLDELTARGYDAIRIDPYPHLVAAAAERVWELIPVWNVQDWGSPAKNRVRVQPALNQFIRKCGDRGLRVALSTWFRQDTANTRLKIRSPEQHGQVWKSTLDSIAADGLLKYLLYVDLCNEFPLDIWAPFVPKGMLRASPRGARWMRDATAVVRHAYPGLDYTFSLTSEWDTWSKQDVSMLDFLELHIWMASASDFYAKKNVDYNYERFSLKGYEHLVDRARPLYLSKPEYWKSKLRDRIELAANWSRISGRPLITTECWSLVDYKDWPLLEWGWLKDLCETGVTSAAATGRWVSMASSNFCGPQFAGMWRDIPLAQANYGSDSQRAGATGSSGWLNLPKRLMCRAGLRAHSGHMSSTNSNNLSSFSQALSELVSETASGVVAIKSAAYRVTSGVALGGDLVAVASHSLRREDRVPVIAANGSEATGAVLGRDPGIDLAILKAEGLTTRTLPKADTSTLKAGLLAVVVGLTADVGATASLGILGAVGPERRTWRGGSLDYFLRLDANVYPSQSGAAVVNAEGQLIGMATPALSRHSTLVLPVSTIERIARELAEQGRIRHGYLGVGVQPVEIPENLRSKMQSESTGLIVLSVETGSPAEKAGLQLGDILLTLNRKGMTDIGELHTALRGEIIGTQVEAIVLRGGAPIVLEVTVAERAGKR